MSEHPVPNIAKNTFSPRGEYIDLAILHNATTNQQGGIDIAAAVWAPFYFQGHKLLDVGDKLLGTASAGKLRDRMLVTFDTVIFKDGRSLKLNAVAQDTDGTLGIKGFMVGDAFLQSMSSVLLDAAASFMSTFKDMTNNNTPSPFTSTSNGQQEVMNAKNGGINTAQGAAQSIAKMVAQDIEENKPYLLVIAGTRCRGYLKAYIDVSTREYGQ